MGGGADRLSSLSDDLLASIISLLPTREAVRTAALSRRWRQVWLRTDSLILDTRSYGRHDAGTQDRLFSEACQFLDAAGRCSPVRELSLSVHGRNQNYFERVMGNSMWGSSFNLMASLLAASALRYLEEVRVRLEVVESPSHYPRDKEPTSWVYKLDPANLPGHTLRLLDLVYCRLESPPNSAAAVSFPRLSSLRLYKCSSSTQDLEAWIRTAPSLRSMHIQDHDFYSESETRSDRFELHSPSLTALTLVSGSWTSNEHIVEVDAPRLRTFKHKGKLQAFSMKTQATNLVRVDLTVVQQIYCKNGDEVETWFAPFWEMLHNFHHVKAIKLKVPTIEGIAVHKDMQHEHLFMLPNLERLELKGLVHPDRKTDAALAIANLLQCCPVLQDLRIQIPTDPYQLARYVNMSKEVQLSDFDASMDVFRRRFSKEMMVNPRMLHPEVDGSSQTISVLPGLTGCRFRCLDRHFKNVTLQFELKELDSFEVSLAKFFAENCMVLEVLQIDDGRHNFLSHINWMVEGWRANASKRRKHDSADLSKQMGEKKHNYRVYNAE